MNAAGVAGNQRVPIRQGITKRQAAVGAGFWQPVQAQNNLRVELHAFRVQDVPLLISGAFALCNIQQAADHPCEEYVATILILQLMQAALGTAVTEGFPLLRGHFF